MKIELHLLQNFPPSNLNRDDTGAPKDCEFGGFRRARISSQCLKRSIRRSDEFRHELEGRVGTRTQMTSEEVARVLVEKHHRDPVKATAIARAALSALIGTIDEDGVANVLFYIGKDEIEDIANRLDGKWDDLSTLVSTPEATPVDAKETKKRGKGAKGTDGASALDEAVNPVAQEYRKARAGSVGSVDIALFGRMLANAPDLNIDAACQVAHAISTNKLFSDFDYWTAVDDLKHDDASRDRGAANIGTMGFNSSCFYRYAVIDADKLANNLGGDRDLAIEGIRSFIRGAIAAIPTGKQNGTAAHCPPEFIFAVAREKGMPWSLVNAFERPAQPDGRNGLFESSVAALDSQWSALADMYGSDGAHRFVKVRKGTDVLNSLADAQVDNVDALVQGVVDTLTKHWANGQGGASA
jgi:CRISPR system Cascade subunit CasC